MCAGFYIYYGYIFCRAVKGINTHIIIFRFTFVKQNAIISLVMKTSLKFLKRISVAIFGLFIAALGEFCMVKPNVGTGAWQTLNDGVAVVFKKILPENIALKLNIDYGWSSIFVAFIVIAADLSLKEKIGLGTVLDALIYGLAYKLYDLFIPITDNISYPVRIAILCAGMFIENVGQYFYIGTGLSCGPRDLFVIAVGKRLKKLPIGAVTLIVNIVVLILGYLFGATVGIGTIIACFGCGLSMHLTFKILKFEPRNVKNESAVESIKNLISGIKAEKELKLKTAENSVNAAGFNTDGESLNGANSTTENNVTQKTGQTKNV